MRRESMESQIHHRVHSRSDSLDDGGDSSSHHDVDDDIFTDHSSRNSLSSFDDPNDVATKSVPYESQERRQSFLSNGGESPRGRSPRVSGVSIISGLSQYDKEDFVPTSRDKRRIPFRTPSAVRAMQMSSPTPSVYGGASPRSGKRRSGTPGNGLPTISRLGSPTVSTQYSPKGRSTPPRFKSRKEAPLVLLHVTLLPLQWMWGHVMNSLDVVNGKALDERGEIYNAPEQLKTLRDAWRELQDRVGDTVLERGVLLPHPQNDYEVLEERLLEALELPLRRRARILECGHYLGPANVMAEDEEESEDEYAESGRAKEEKKHWCNTCRGEIKYEDLGPGKVFRVKVYASNGLMKAGAWEACWKEMERVDIEVEPIVDPSLQSELEELAVVVELDQEDRMRREEEAAALEAEREQEQEQVRESIEKDEPAAQEFAREASLPVRQEEAYTNTPEQHHRSSLMSSPPPSALQLAMHASPLQPPPSSALRALSPALAEPMDTSDERRRRDEERMREIYGEAPPPLRLEHEAVPLHTEPTASRAPPPEPAYMPPPQTPQSPSEQVYERRQRRESPRRRNLDDAGFVELFCEAIKVLLRDSKNVAIIVLCIFLMCMLMRPTSHPPAFAHDPVPYRYDPKPEVSINTQTAVTEALSSQATSQAPVFQPVSEAQAPIVEKVMDVPSIVAEVLSSHTPETSMVVEEPETSVPEPTAEAVEEAPSSVVEVSPSESPETPAVEDEEVSDVSEASEAAEPVSEDIDSAVVEPEVLASEASDDVSSEDHISGFSEPVVEVLDAEVPEDVNSDVQSLAEEEIVDTRLFDEAAAEITPDVEALEVHEASDFFEPTAQESFDVLVEVEETLSQEASDDAALEERQSEPVEPTAEVVEEPLNSAEIESEETPDAAAVEEEDVTIAPEPELTETVMEEIVTEEADLNATILEEVPLDEPTLDDVVKEPPQIVMDTPEIEEPLAATPSTDTSDEAPAAEATHSCESYLQSAKSASFAITQTPAQPTAWPESPVTEWKTVKVFETVTETVRISVTATEIVSTIPTVETIRAPPATVEETVYETETIRVTVTESAEAEATGVGHDEL
ncbi:hypothetical protein QBC46DRAFT_388229 [Diplogelasinospora grovesii]|uniref:Pathway-specific nitrogen regulator n=1 Tax=Diplogelasinospora grovesii TaxID=303347 RepID=A0AAN6N6D8_9PEZI|nr:hypothetical protein QBC46DRAFT_388229 [Diplogelasinospora grovesii]